jgi:thiol-disulfide isomerase/thioredoxin
MNRRACLLGLGLGSGLGLAGAAAAAAPRRPAAPIASLDRLRVTMKRSRGRVLLLHFWASWCRPCLPGLALVGELARAGKAQGIEVHSFSLDEPSPQGAEAVARTLAERGAEGMSRTILRLDNPDAVIGQVDPSWTGSIPAYFAYDRKGKLHKAHVGESLTREKLAALVAGLTGDPVKK